MTLWQQFKSIGLLQGSTEKLVAIYSLPADEVVLCLRVAYAKWIESSIGKVSPRSFLLGLRFQIHSTLRRSAVHATDFKNLRHTTHLSKYMNFLKTFSSPQEIDSLYSKFLSCLMEEYKIVKLRNMEQELPTEMYKFLEASLSISSTVETGNEIDHFRSIITVQLTTLIQTETDLLELIEQLRTSWGKFYQWNNYYVETSVSGPRNCPSKDNLLVAVSMDFLDEGTRILNYKATLEAKVKLICDMVASMGENLRSYLHFYEKLHLFSNRAGNFGDAGGIESVGMQVDAVVQCLQRVSSCMEICQTEFDFQSILRMNYDMIIATNAQSDRASLLTPAAYENKFNELVINLRELIWPLYQIFTLVVDCQPPMVIMKGSRYTPISLRFFNLNNVFTDKFKIQVYLVNETTVKRIRNTNEIPGQVPSAGTIVVTNRSSRETNSSARRRGGNLNRSNACRRRRSADEVNQMTGNAMVSLEDNCALDKKCYHIEKELIVTTIERDSRSCNRQSQPARGRHANVARGAAGHTTRDSDNVTSEKVALLFVMELSFGNFKKQVWTVSLPMIVAAHGSQNEKAWLTIAWDDALSVRKRLAFDVHKMANWSQVSEILQGTFEVLVKSSLKPSHLVYLKNKAQECLGSKFPDNISKNALSEDKGGRMSFWSWFYSTLLVIKESCHFHEAWENGYIEGFIDYEGATDLLRNSCVQPGTFVVRFSDAKPGSLTLVFMAFNRDIYKMQPVEVYKSKSASDCALSFLRILNVNESTQGKEVFLRVFPNICKRLAFKKFYDIHQASDKEIPKEYVQVANMISLLPVQRNGENESRSGGNESNQGNGNDKDVDAAVEASPDFSNIFEEDNCDGSQQSPNFERMDTSLVDDGGSVVDLADILAFYE